MRRRQELPEPGDYRNEHPRAEEPGHDGEDCDLPHKDGRLHRVELIHVFCVLQLLDGECHHQQAGHLHQDDHSEYLQTDGTLQLAQVTQDSGRNPQAGQREDSGQRDRRRHVMAQHVVDDRYTDRQGYREGHDGRDEEPFLDGPDESGDVDLIHAHEEEEQYNADIEEEAQVFAGGHHACHRTQQDAHQYLCGQRAVASPVGQTFRQLGED